MTENMNIVTQTAEACDDRLRVTTLEPESGFIVNRVVNGKHYRVRVFFQADSNETLQQKYEKLLMNTILQQQNKKSCG